MLSILNGEAESKSVSTRIAEARKLQCERREHRSQLLGGFAGGFYSKDFRTPTFPQVSGTRAAQRPQRTAQKSGTHGKIGAHFLQNRPEVGGGTGRVQGKARQKALPNTRTHLRPLFMRAGHPDTSTPCVLAALSPTRPAKQLKSRKARPRKQSRQPDDSAPCPLVPRCCPGPGMARPVNSSTEAAVGRDISRSPLQRIVGTSGRKRHEERSHGRRNS